MFGNYKNIKRLPLVVSQKLYQRPRRRASALQTYPSLLLIGAIVAILCLSLRPLPVGASELLGASDYVTSEVLNETDVVHNVGFVIPVDGHTIVPTDYIRVELTNFTGVTAPTSGNGWTGTPTFGSIGNVALITGVSADVGAGIGISGVTATNPDESSEFDVTIEITNDLAGTIVYDSITIDAEVIGGESTVSLTISAPSSNIELEGFTSPDAFVTVSLDGSVAGTTTSDSNGTFSELLTGLNGNTDYVVSLYAEDLELRQTQTISFTVHTLPDITVTISNIVIPTTIAIGETIIFQGDTIEITGLAHPFSQVTVFVGNSPNYSTVVQAQGNGIWEYEFDSGENPLNPGSHSTYAREAVMGGYTSVFTQALGFQVNSCGIADINCDGEVDLVDFSVLLFYWEDSNPANSRADINGDGIVDLTDFSIMLTNWTG